MDPPQPNIWQSYASRLVANEQEVMRQVVAGWKKTPIDMDEMTPQHRQAFMEQLRRHEQLKASGLTGEEYAAVAAANGAAITAIMRSPRTQSSAASSSSAASAAAPAVPAAAAASAACDSQSLHSSDDHESHRSVALTPMQSRKRKARRAQSVLVYVQQLQQPVCVSLCW